MKFELPSSDNVAPLLIELMLGRPLAGSLPSVVYHRDAPLVRSVTVNEAALAPTMSGLAALKTNRATAIPLLTRPGAVPMALMVKSGMAGTRVGAT